MTERQDLRTRLRTAPTVLMEGALGERLKREYRLQPDDHVGLASLVYDPRGRAALAELWNEYADIAHRHGLPILAATPTRRANRERVAESRYDGSIVRDNVSLLRSVQERSPADVHVGGLMGCRGDAYRATDVLPVAEAREFHSWQAELFADAGAEFLYAGIMPALPEATGMAQAMGDSGLPYIISFMIQRDGRLLDGTTIDAAIRSIDGAVETQPVCYLTNCVHPDVLYQALSQPFNATNVVRDRLWGIQANASRLPPQELDASATLESSDPSELAHDMMRLRDDKKLRVFGGCCGTDGAHLEEIARRLGDVPEKRGGRGTVDVSLRPVSAADLPTIDRWASDMAEHMSRTRPYAESAERHDPGSGLHWYVIAADGADVGTVWIELLPAGSEAVLGIFLGDPSLFGRGIGAAAVGLAVAAFRREHPHVPIVLRVRRSNARAVACYRRAGFSVTGSGSKPLPSGEVVPYLHMTRET
jgi:S-methylmethionine-dependent homocysteine/selenocysteine methylase/ribosomal protein S18 acetylase RimI-like enzyme